MTKSTAKSAEKSPLPGSDEFAEPRYVWLFQCSARPALHAATLDRMATNLPKNACQSGEWSLNGQLVVGPQNAPMAGLDVEALIVGIARDGYYLWSAEVEPLPDTLRLMR
jgi:hypothetical protein